MDKYATIENKLQSFFQKKASELNLNFADLSIIITTNNNKTLNYTLYNGGKIVDKQNLDDILNLNMLEKMYASNSKVEATLNDAIDKINAAQNDERCNIQLLLKSNKTYFALKNWTILKEINLTEIL